MIKHILELFHSDIDKIIINRIKEIHPDVTGLSVAWIKRGVIVYMDKEPKKIRMRTIRNDRT